MNRNRVVVDGTKRGSPKCSKGQAAQDFGPAVKGGKHLGRNGVDRLFDEASFPNEAERLGIGITDGALLDFTRGRIERLQQSGQPFFLTTLTSGMHHPFSVPTRHPDVADLAAQSDGYLTALRYFDLEFERVFTELREQGLLKNTIVVVLGDHGRHEPMGHTETERQAGHFMSPLFIWLDESLRSAEVYQPRGIYTVASQVDLAPTLLAVNGLPHPRWVNGFLYGLALLTTGGWIWALGVFVARRRHVRGSRGALPLVLPSVITGPFSAVSMTT